MYNYNKNMVFDKNKKPKKYTLIIKNIPEKFYNKFVHWEDIWGGEFTMDYYTIDEVKEVIKSLPKSCVVKVYKCSIETIDYVDDEQEITINLN